MLTELKFVQGAVARKDFVPALTHFAIADGHVRGYNGTLALSSPIPFDITCNPKAGPLVKAIANCDETAQLSMTKAGRLSIKSGKFKAFIDCVDGDVPHVNPEGDTVQLDGEALLAAIKCVHPFIGDDASRPWQTGVLLAGQSAYATNNVTVIEYWTGANFPVPLNIPRAAVKEILRVNEAPTHVQMTENSVTFHFSGQRWLRTQLLETTWPDLNKIMNKACNPVPMDNTLFDAIESIKPFADKMGRVIFSGNGIATHPTEGEGASRDIDGWVWPGVYSLEMLSLLKGVATSVDWSLYPGACIFYGDRIRGAIIGMHQ